MIQALARMEKKHFLSGIHR